MHPRERYHLWPAHLRSHPANLGDTRILWALGRLLALVYNRTRGKGEASQSPADMLDGLLPDLEGHRTGPGTHSIFETMMTATLDHLRAEQDGITRRAREDEADG